MHVDLETFASATRSTKGYFILYQDKDILISTAKTDPDIIISLMSKSEETNFVPTLRHIRINKESLEQAIEKEREL